jgi:hypothetical protein
MTARKLVNLKCRLRNALQLRNAKFNPLMWSRERIHRFRVARHNALQYLASRRYGRDRAKFLAALGE